ncbi:MAG TPA: hypothetical protein VHC22_18020 [Pirellulales bacterium]|nr:hypothetical protein [Pirellulales bacterium]
MILIYGILSEPPLAMVINELERRGAAYIGIAQRKLSEIQWSLKCSRNGLLGSFHIGGTSIDLCDIGAIYARPIDYRFLPEYASAASTKETRGRIEEGDRHMRTILNQCQAAVVNRPRAMMSNVSKPLQLQIIREFGFSIPRTIATNNIDLVKEFEADAGTLIYKSMSSQRSLVKALDGGDRSRLDAIRTVPVQFQEFISGVDVRVHVINDAVFGCGIVHQGVDYRDLPAEDRPRLFSIDVPEAVKACCIRICRELGLVFGGIDLRIAPDGRIYCFEVNPSPGYSYYERNVGQPIASVVADYLVNNSIL